MPERETIRVNLGNGQINLNGTMLDVNGITFTQDGVEAARFEGDPIFRLDNHAEITATATIDNYDTFEAAARRLMDNTRTATTYNPYYFTAEDLLQIGIDRAQHPDGYVAQTYMFDNHWETYNPYSTYHNPHSINYDELVFPKDEVYVAKVIEDDFSAKKNHKLDKFLDEFAPKEAV